VAARRGLAGRGSGRERQRAAACAGARIAWAADRQAPGSDLPESAANPIRLGLSLRPRTSASRCRNQPGRDRDGHRQASALWAGVVRDAIRPSLESSVYETSVTTAVTDAILRPCWTRRLRSESRSGRCQLIAPPPVPPRTWIPITSPATIRELRGVMNFSVNYLPPADGCR
jgi:hypothetical protein